MKLIILGLFVASMSMSSSRSLGATNYCPVVSGQPAKVWVPTMVTPFGLSYGCEAPCPQGQTWELFPSPYRYGCSGTGPAAGGPPPVTVTPPVVVKPTPVPVTGGGTPPVSTAGLTLQILSGDGQLIGGAVALQSAPLVVQLYNSNGTPNTQSGVQINWEYSGGVAQVLNTFRVPGTANTGGTNSYSTVTNSLGQASILAIAGFFSPSDQGMIISNLVTATISQNPNSPVTFHESVYFDSGDFNEGVQAQVLNHAGSFQISVLPRAGKDPGTQISVQIFTGESPIQNTPGVVTCAESQTSQVFTETNGIATCTPVFHKPGPWSFGFQIGGTGNASAYYSGYSTLISNP